MPIRGHYLLDGQARQLLVRSVPGRPRRVGQWVALVIITLSLFAVTGVGIVAGLVAVVVGAAAIGVLVWWSHRRLAALPPEWISIAFDDDGLHVETQTATYPTTGGAEGGPDVPTGVRTSSTNLVAWDAIVRVNRTARCFALTIAGERHVVIPVAAFSDADAAALANVLVERGLLTTSR